ncbi:hypothetical protein [Mycobacterium tuberculosis]|uniref:hypothetical protein n=1 Tax=Mycobacterium tuberculosis TaxID=1773 RepID=UPI00272C61EF|nr:hypothetical protein [Mycobacterium tuberculosis]
MFGALGTVPLSAWSAPAFPDQDVVCGFNARATWALAVFGALGTVPLSAWSAPAFPDQDVVCGFNAGQPPSAFLAADRAVPFWRIGSR